MLPGERIRGVALPTVGLSEEQKRFLLEFLRRLGVEPLEIQLSAAKLREHVAAIPEKVNVVLLPIVEEAQKQLEGLQKRGWVWAGQAGGHALVGLPLKGESLYRSCVELGLALDRRFRRVRRAYQRALEAAAPA
jgi:hypothetical protein